MKRAYYSICVAVPVEDAASLREMAEYFSAAAAAESGGREEMAHTSNRPVTVIVYQNGDQVNFFRVVDRDSSAASPTAESLRYVVVMGLILMKVLWIGGEW